MHLFFIILVLNFISYIKYPDGIYKTVSLYGSTAKYAFLGLNNQITPIIIISTMLLFIKLYEDDYKIKKFTLLFGITIILNVIFMSSSTAFAGVLIIAVFFIVNCIKKISNKIILPIIFAIFFMFVIFRVQNIFAFIIEGVLDGDLTFTSRTGIWDRALLLIKEKLILGYGCSTFSTIIIDRNAHNFYLQIILQSGLVGFAAYFNILKVATSSIVRNKNSTLIPCVISYLMCLNFEVYSQAWLIILLGICYYLESEKIVQKERNKKSEYYSKEFHI